MPMATKGKPRNSLADSLALLQDSAPVEFDPEQDERSNHSEDQDSDSEQLDKTAHYLTDLPTSQLRRKSKITESETLDQPKYKGVKTSVKEMFGNQFNKDEDQDDGEEEEDEWDDELSLGQDQDSEEQEEEQSQDQDEDDDDEDDDEGNEDEEEQEQEQEETTRNSKAKSKKKLRFAEEELGPTNSSSSSSLRPTHTDDSSTLDSQFQSDSNLIKSLREKNKADAKKAREIQLQIKGWERSLEGRIRLQGLVRNLNRVELLRRAKEKGKEKEKEERLPHSDSLISTLSSLSSTLFNLRTSHLIKNHPSTSESLSELRSSSDRLNSVLKSSEKSEKIRRRKRKRDTNDEEGEEKDPDRDEEEEEDQEISNDDDDDEAHLNQIQSLLEMESNLYHPLQINLLNKWSSKVSNASSSSSSSSFSNNLKSINQSSGKQVELTLNSGDGLSRLISRTKNLRDISVIGNSNPNDSKNLDDNTLKSGNTGDNGNSDGDEINQEIFDDSDFYNSLLKELIESKGSSNSVGGGGKKVGGVEIDGKGLQVLDSDSLNFGKKKKVVDTRASKGRRLKYEPIAALQAFMPPIPRQLWSTEQTEQLFRQIKLAHGSSDTSEYAGEDLNGLQAELNGNIAGKAVDEKMQDGEKVDLAGLKVFA